MGMSYVIESAVGLTNEKKICLYGNVLLFLFKGQIHQELSANLAAAGIDFDVHYFRIEVQKNGRLLRDGKAWVHAKFNDVTLTGHSLTRKDQNALALAIMHPPLRKKLQELKRLKRTVFTLSQYDQWVAEAINAPDVVKYARSLVFKKLRFLTNYGMCLDNLYSDLIHAGLLAIMKDFPCWENFDHLKKSAKVAIRNRTMNVIDEHTSAKRQSLTTDDQGNVTSLKTSFDVIADMPAHVEGQGFTTHSYLSVGISGTNKNFELVTSLKQLMSRRGGLKPLQRRYLQLLIGEQDDDFSRVLGSRNSDALERMDFTRYRSKVESFLGIPSDAADRFLQSLRRQL